MTTYNEAKPILGKIRAARRILLSLHRSPDADSVGSNLALLLALEKIGKTDVEVISPDKVPEYVLFLHGADRVRQEDIVYKDLQGFDLFITLDASAPHMLTRNVAVPTFPDTLAVIVIDHHATNTKYGQINLVDDKVSSTSELLFNLTDQWNVELDKDIATCLLTGIAGDTGTFRWAITKDTLSAAGSLLECGADFGEINFNLYQRVPIECFRFAAKVFEKLQFEKMGKCTFAWVSISAAEGDGRVEKDSSFRVIDLLKSIEGVDFALLVTQDKDEPGLIKGNLRSRTDFDVSKIAVSLGGGGHKAAAGFAIRGEFEDVVKRVLGTIKDVVKG
ncbi:MAG: DHH family phosphoesterase [Candidatus Blackburnbacteria bacterium]|nr:DHH family phosphoesterase [Candidatus Blackburnbacteria bacterium]